MPALPRMIVPLALGMLLTGAANTLTLKFQVWLLHTTSAAPSAETPVEMSFGSNPGKSLGDFCTVLALCATRTITT